MDKRLNELREEIAYLSGKVDCEKRTQLIGEVGSEFIEITKANAVGKYLPEVVELIVDVENKKIRLQLWNQLKGGLS